MRPAQVGLSARSHVPSERGAQPHLSLGSHRALGMCHCPGFLSFSTQSIGFGDPGKPGLAARLCAVNTVPLLGQTAACNNTEFRVELGRSVTRHSQTGCY